MPSSRELEKRTAKYMKEIRDADRAKLSVREYLREGLVSGGAGLLALRAMRNFRPFWAHASHDSDGLTGTSGQPVSPPNTPFQDPLPIPPTLAQKTLTPAPTEAANTAAGEAARAPHQKWQQFLPQKTYELEEVAVSEQFYPAVDGVPPSTTWRFRDTVNNNVSPIIRANYQEPIVVRIHNRLPANNGGFGINQTTTHLHNGHTASESDGSPVDFYDAGKFKDYHYPNVRAGFASTHAPLGDLRETMSFLWFHDHRFDFTAQNVYKGLASMYLLFSADQNQDTGDEGTGFRLPSGAYDIPMIFADKVFDPTTGQLFFDRFNLNGILGDRYTVNGKIQPYLNVYKRRYRFRLLDGGPSRFYRFHLSNNQPLIQISSDGNLLPTAIPTTNGILVGVAERVDVIVDFTNATTGSRIYLQNRLPQTKGEGPDGTGTASGAVTDLVEFRVQGSPPEPDLSLVPTTLIPNPIFQNASSKTRSFVFDKGRDGLWVINDQLFDPNVISFQIHQNRTETWNLDGKSRDWSHPVHIHFEEFRILKRDGSASSVPANEGGRKDVVPIGNFHGTAQLKMQFRDWLGHYPMHCHNTVHEDHAMMLRWEIIP
jgi:FtsP/CotA-like multicopper oxidase with cupredoxin domain